MTLQQYDYIFAVGTIFAFLDAWNIGANDVANSWATTVASRSLTYLQAMIAASVMEFAGAMGAGARVTDTIRTKIVDPDLFESDPAVLMLGMLCAVIASALFLTMATKIGFPVSTTHSILGGVLGMGIASVGADDVTWVARDDDGNFQVKGGVVAVFLAWIIAPCVSAGFASIIFLVTKFGVLLRKNPVMMAFFTIPFYFGVTAALLCMLIVTKGGQIKSNLDGPKTAGVIVGVGAGWSLVIITFLMPWIYRRVIKDDWPLRWYHIPMGPLLLNRGEVPPPPSDHAGLKNFYEGRLTREELDARRTGASSRGDVEASADGAGEKDVKGSSRASESDVDVYDRVPENKSLVGPKPEGPLMSGPVLYWWLKYIFLHGVDKDVVNLQRRKDALSGDLEDTHARASHFDNKVEYMFAFLQVMTAATASFTHGANDVANAIGPYATIYEIWRDGNIEGSKSGVPIWILAFGGGGIVVGLWTYGYHIMKNLGNRLTLQSPARGFSMELGAAITVILATKLKLPISTTQCITGATVGVGLCNGDWRAINWRMVLWIYLGWMITLPLSGILSGCIMGFVINAPQWSAGPP